MKLIYAICFLLISYNSASAQTCTALASGAYNNAATWDCGHIPGPTEIAVIPNGITVTINVNNTIFPRGLYVYGTFTFTNTTKFTLINTAIVNIYAGGLINGGNGASEIVFQGATTAYKGAFNQPGAYFYTATASGVGVLPVKLTSFTYEKSATGINLFWKTSTEISTKQYNVEYTTDNGKTWVNAGVVASKNNATSEQNYQYSLPASVTGSILVRLRVVDLDGKNSYSDILSISGDNTTKFLVYPTTTSSFVTVSFSEIQSKTTIQVVSASGNVVKNILVTGLNNRVDVSNLQKGVYIVRTLTPGEAAVSQKIIVQ